jgi:hypothetical protein
LEIYFGAKNFTFARIQGQLEYQRKLQLLLIHF